ncbi:hypothetical protein FOA52_012943 [Chlamydomonas sp. UWO 241]|nr:hypothetical protein FOA52_012943 [Chlamydomonas sp. UWO 241]
MLRGDPSNEEVADLRGQLAEALEEARSALRQLMRVGQDSSASKGYATSASAARSGMEIGAEEAGQEASSSALPRGRSSDDGGGPPAAAAVHGAHGTHGDGSPGEAPLLGGPSTTGRARAAGRTGNTRMHPANKYYLEEPDFGALAAAHPELARFVTRTPDGRCHYRYTSWEATRQLTSTLLKADFSVEWWLPEGHLVPTLTSRANYLHWVHDLLQLSRPEEGARSAAGSALRGLDIGCGANYIYCLLGAAIYGWRMAGTDVTDTAVAWALWHVRANPRLAPLLEVRDSRSLDAGGMDVGRAGGDGGASSSGGSSGMAVAGSTGGGGGGGEAGGGGAAAAARAVLDEIDALVAREKAAARGEPAPAPSERRTGADDDGAAGPLSPGSRARGGGGGDAGTGGGANAGGGTDGGGAAGGRSRGTSGVGGGEGDAGVGGGEPSGSEAAAAAAEVAAGDAAAAADVAAAEAAAVVAAGVAEDEAAAAGAAAGTGSSALGQLRAMTDEATTATATVSVSVADGHNGAVDIAASCDDDGRAGPSVTVDEAGDMTSCGSAPAPPAVAAAGGGTTATGGGTAATTTCGGGGAGGGALGGTEGRGRGRGGVGGYGGGRGAGGGGALKGYGGGGGGALGAYGDAADSELGLLGADASGGVLTAALTGDRHERFAFSMCNPPFFASMAEAGTNPATACGGTPMEMVCPGGELAFIMRMVDDSVRLGARIHWYTTMVGKKATLKALRKELHARHVTAIRTTELAQGKTSRWAIAWSFDVDPNLANHPLPRPGTHAGAAAAQPAARPKRLVSFALTGPNQDGRKLLKAMEAALSAHGASGVAVDLGCWTLTAGLPAPAPPAVASHGLAVDRAAAAHAHAHALALAAAGGGPLPGSSPPVGGGGFGALSAAHHTTQKRQRHPTAAELPPGADAGGSSVALRVNMYQQQRGRFDIMASIPKTTSETEAATFTAVMQKVQDDMQAMWT